jgi:hypothetical protein
MQVTSFNRKSLPSNLFDRDERTTEKCANLSLKIAADVALLIYSEITVKNAHVFQAGLDTFCEHR